MIDNINYLVQIRQEGSIAWDKRPLKHLNVLLESEIGAKLSSIVRINPDLNNKFSQTELSLFGNYCFIEI